MSKSALRGAFFPGLLGLLLLAPLPVLAQIGGGGGGIGGGGGFGGGQGGGNNQNGGGFGGIAIDATGVVTPAFQKEQPGNKLAQKRLAGLAGEFLPEDVNVSTMRRMVSLVRLEKAVQAAAKDNKPLPPDIEYLSGLQQIEYVFAYPETGDLVIAGPAEGFAPNEIGRVVGVTTGRPVLRLDDLIIALRTVPSKAIIGCSIDPQQQNLANFNSYLQQNSSAATIPAIAQRFREMTQVLGMQTVSVFGVPSDSHFAHALVEADYRMKLISVGLETPKLPGFRSHLQMMGRGGNTLQRWWFTPFYDSILATEDNNAFQFVGQRVQLMTQSEQVSASGQRSASAFKPVSLEKFSQQFTERYSDLAEVSPIFAELQNLIDLAVLAALFEKEELPQRVGWKMSVFLDEKQTPVARMETPASLSSVFNTRKSGSMIVGLVGGGVSIAPHSVLREVKFDRTGNRDLTDRVTQSAPDKALTRWWWDAPVPAGK